MSTPIVRLAATNHNAAQYGVLSYRRAAQLSLTPRCGSCSRGISDESGVIRVHSDASDPFGTCAGHVGVSNPSPNQRGTVQGIGRIVPYDRATQYVGSVELTTGCTYEHLPPIGNAWNGNGLDGTDAVGRCAVPVRNGSLVREVGRAARRSKRHFAVTVTKRPKEPTQGLHPAKHQRCGGRLAVFQLTR